MTGFGRGVASSMNGTQVVVEISAVNSRKQLEMRASVPKELGIQDAELRTIVQKQLARGTINISLNYQLGYEDMKAKLPLDPSFASVVAKELTAFAQKEQLPLPTIHDILSVPGVVKISDSTTELVKPLIYEALSKALNELEAMRTREGEALKAELKARGENLKALVGKIAAREEEAIIYQKQKIMERIARLGVILPIDDERLAKEVAFYVDKSDITEETVRLKSHLVQYDGFMEMESDAGRNLDFLCQEMSREVNTLSAKATDSPICEDALAIKIELSKIKEQIMNIE